MTSLPHVIARAAMVDAWHEAAELLTRDGDRFNLCIHIEQPAAVNEIDLARYDPHKIDRNVKSVYDVANTIFPADSRYHRGGVAEFFNHFVAVYERGQRRHPNAWGTYFLRLAQFGATRTNQISRIIDAIRNWRTRPRAAFVLHLSGPEFDRPRALGAPCWQYAEFIRTDDNVLSLSAAYRSHDYFQKGLGNFAGLTRLLRFVCHHTGMTPGTLTCLSVYAHLQARAADTRRLLAGV